MDKITQEVAKRFAEVYAWTLNINVDDIRIEYNELVGEIVLWWHEDCVATIPYYLIKR